MRSLAPLRFRWRSPRVGSATTSSLDRGTRTRGVRRELLRCPALGVTRTPAPAARPRAVEPPAAERGPVARRRAAERPAAPGPRALAVRRPRALVVRRPPAARRPRGARQPRAGLERRAQVGLRRR